jgi:spore coat protein U-like protein
MKYSNALKSALSAAALGFLALGLASTPAFATISTTPLAVSANVVSNCTISVGTMSFGDYSGVASNSSADFSITCSKSSTYTVGLDAGLTTGATVGTRQMGITQPAGGLNYSLSVNSGHSTNWGNTVGTDTVSGTGTGTSQTLTVYGQIPANQFVPVGAYADSVVATIAY